MTFTLCVLHFTAIDVIFCSLKHTITPIDGILSSEQNKIFVVVNLAARTTHVHRLIKAMIACVYQLREKKCGAGKKVTQTSTISKIQLKINIIHLKPHRMSNVSNFTVGTNGAAHTSPLFGVKRIYSIIITLTYSKGKREELNWKIFCTPAPARVCRASLAHHIHTYRV